MSRYVILGVSAELRVRALTAPSACCPVDAYPKSALQLGLRVKFWDLTHLPLVS